MSKRPRWITRAVTLLFGLGFLVYGVLLVMLGLNAERDGAVKSDAILVLGS